MTLVVGFNLGPYALIGSDTRVCYFPPDREFVYRDDSEKLQPTSMGLISGAGLTNLLDPVKARLKEEEITNTDQIRDVIRAERRRVEARWPKPEPRVRDGIAHTAWMLTYVNGDGTAATLADVKMRLAITLPHEDYALGLIAPNSGSMIPPTGLTPAEEEELRGMCDDGMQPWDPNPGSMMGSITHHSILIAKVMRRASELSDMVAPTFQLGLHAFTIVGISTIAGPPDYDFEWQWYRGMDDVEAG